MAMVVKPSPPARNALGQLKNDDKCAYAYETYIPSLARARPSIIAHKYMCGSNTSSTVQYVTQESLAYVQCAELQLETKHVERWRGHICIL